jgi:hypothetical protein
MIRRRKPSPALIVAILALIVAMAGGAYAVTVPKKSVGPKQLKAGAVKTAKIRDGAVTSDKIANKAVTSGKFFLSVVQNLNFGLVGNSDCATLPVSTPGITSNDHVLVTPPPGWAPTFIVGGIPDPPNNQVLIQACNNFFAGSGDPDGGGGPYKVLLIR